MTAQGGRAQGGAERRESAEEVSPSFLQLLWNWTRERVRKAKADATNS